MRCQTSQNSYTFLNERTGTGNLATRTSVCYIVTDSQLPNDGKKNELEIDAFETEFIRDVGDENGTIETKCLTLNLDVADG